MRLQSSQLSMNLCDWWSRLNRFRNLDGFHPFILISSLTIGPLGAKRQTWEPPYIRCAGNRKSPSQLSHFNGDKRTSIWEFRCSYHMMTSGRHGNVMWHIDMGEDAGCLSFHLFPSLMKMKRETFRNQSDI